MTEERVAVTGSPSQLSAMASTAYIDINGLSYEDYFKKVEEFRNQLRQNWDLNQRVKAFKIAIQLSKLLADTSQLKLYTKKFKMITDIMDEFGQLVAFRIESISKGQQSSIHRKALRTPYQQPMEEARKTCKNWFLKVASIRELLPRFYTELAILKTCDTLLLNSSHHHVEMTNEQFYYQSLKRLSKSIWGFGDPIVALSARAYLCRIAQRLIKFDDCSENCLLFELVLINIEGATVVVSRIEPKMVLTIEKSQCLETNSYFELASNALRNIIGLITSRYDFEYHSYNDEEGTRKKLEILYHKLVEIVGETYCSVLSKSILLNAVLRALPGDIVATHALEILVQFKLAHKLWQQPCEDTSKLEAQLVSAPALYHSLESFALALDGSDHFEELNSSEIKLDILNSIEIILKSLFDASNYKNNSTSLITIYLNCSKSWLSYACHYTNQSTINAMLNKFVHQFKKHFQSNEHYMVLLDIVKMLIANNRTVDEFEQIFKMKCFKELLELFQKDDHKFEVNKWILETMSSNLKSNRTITTKIESKVMIDSLLGLFANINDSMSLLMELDDVEQLSRLVIYFLDKISLCLDLKAQLEVYSKCRANVCNLNPVLEHLARTTLDLARSKWGHLKLKRKKSERDYLCSCLAFAFVTVPAINGLLTRLEVFIEGSRVALNHMSLSLADYYIKQTIVTLLECIHPTSQVENMTRQQEERDGLQVISLDNKASTTSLLNHVTNLVNMVLDFEDHIDLKHKLVLTDMIKKYYHEHSHLVEKVELMNMLEDNDTIVERAT